jgi:hypothetical protein
LAFRQSIVPACLSVGAIVVAAIMVVRLGPSGNEFGGIVQGLTVVFLIWSGFLAGARLFSREFKERHVLLVQTLPLARPLAWAALFLGGLAAGLTALTLLVLVRPSLGALGDFAIPTEVGDPQTLVAVLLLLHLVFFAAGTCYGLLLSGTAVHALGLVATVVVVVQGLMLVVTLRGNPLSAEPAAQESLFDPTNLPGLSEVAVLLVLALILYATLSAWFYVRGEFVLAERRWRNLAWLLTGHVAFFGAFDGLSQMGVNRAPLVLGENTDAVAVSPDGRHLSVIERRAGFPRFSRVQVVEIPTGRLLASREIADLGRLVWSGETLVANLAHGLGVQRSRFPWPPSDTVLFLTKDLHDLRRERLAAGMIVEHLLTQGNEVLVSGRKRVDPIRRVLALSPDGGPPANLIETGEGSLELASLADGSVAALRFGAGEHPRAWLLNPAAKEIPIFGNVGFLPTAMVMGPGVYTGPAIAEEIGRRLPPPPIAATDSPAKPRYVVWSYGERRGWVFALVAKATTRLDVFALGPGEGAWRIVVRDLPTQRLLPLEAIRELSCTPGLGNLQLCPDGRAAWVEGDQVVAFDSITGQKHVFATDPPIAFELKTDSRASGTLIALHHGGPNPNGTIVLDQRSRFYLWPRGADTPAELPSGPSVLDRDFAIVAGGVVYRSRQPEGILFVAPGARARQLWPVR